MPFRGGHRAMCGKRAAVRYSTDGHRDFPLLRGAERFPRAAAAPSRIRARVHARGERQACDRSARRAAYRSRADPRQRRIDTVQPRARRRRPRRRLPELRGDRHPPVAARARRAAARHALHRRCAPRRARAIAAARRLRHAVRQPLPGRADRDDRRARSANRPHARSRTAQAPHDHARLLRARAESRRRNCRSCSIGSTSPAARGLSGCACRAMRRCGASIPPRLPAARRRACCSVTRASSPATYAAACSGKARTGDACAR